MVQNACLQAGWSTTYVCVLCKLFTHFPVSQLAWTPLNDGVIMIIQEQELMNSMTFFAAVCRVANGMTKVKRFAVSFFDFHF